MKNKAFVIGALVVGAVIFIALLRSNKNESHLTQINEPASQVQTESPISGEYFVRSHSPRHGNDLARVMVVEWLDPECEACRQMHPIMKGIINDYQDRVLFVIRYMPFHGNSLYVASALEEAKELGKFDEALDVLFEKQPEWGSHHQPRPELVPDYLVKLGIPADRLQKEFVIAKHGSKIRQDREDGEKAGVRGTPSFFVNQKPLRQLGDQELRAMIDAELAGTAQRDL